MKYVVLKSESVPSSTISQVSGAAQGVLSLTNEFKQTFIPLIGLEIRGISKLSFDPRGDFLLVTLIGQSKCKVQRSSFLKENRQPEKSLDWRVVQGLSDGI